MGILINQVSPLIITPIRYLFFRREISGNLLGYLAGSGPFRTSLQGDLEAGALHSRTILYRFPRVP